MHRGSAWQAEVRSAALSCCNGFAAAPTAHPLAHAGNTHHVPATLAAVARETDSAKLVPPWQLARAMPCGEAEVRGRRGGVRVAGMYVGAVHSDVHG